MADADKFQYPASTSLDRDSFTGMNVTRFCACCQIIGSQTQISFLHILEQPNGALVASSLPDAVHLPITEGIFLLVFKSHEQYDRREQR
jgi:hypothetical protein